ncbi:glycerol-3-phosphate cytidylyltransferase [Betaproteobacteria bacterium]|nr:glycerol-3-phosphate cytidylyltransferase [Betaproteobacteria bacterium]
MTTDMLDALDMLDMLDIDDIDNNIDEDLKPLIGNGEPRRILTYGTFDTFHWGHINLLRRAKALTRGGALIVALSTDEFNAIKGKKAYHDFATRKRMLAAIKYVDAVIPENTWEQKINDVQTNKIDCVIMGDDWQNDPHFELIRDYCDVIYLPRTINVSSAQIKEALESGH